MPSVPPTNPSDTLFREVMENALDYLDRSIAEVDSHPKYSVINFFTAVELILKARLLVEHWSLIALKPGEVSLADLEAGKFRSVGFDAALARLRKVAGLTFPEVEKDAYRVVREHRNRLVHFFNASYAKKLSEQDARKLHEEQFRAWCYLQRRIKEWRDVLESFQGELLQIDSRLKQNWGFLQAKFEHVKPDLQDSNAVVVACPMCSLPAAKRSDHDSSIDRFQCLVCELSHAVLRIPCPDCSVMIEVREHAEGECPCGSFSADLHWMVEELDDREPPRKESLVPIYCGECEHPEGTVIVLNGKFLCVWCLVAHDSVDSCDWCGSSNAGRDVEASMIMGCAICDGGWRDN